MISVGDGVARVYGLERVMYGEMLLFPGDIYGMAFPLTPALREEIRQRFAQYARKEIVIDQEIDPELIGGMVAQMGSVVLDGSLRNELLRLKTDLTGDHRGGLV